MGMHGCEAVGGRGTQGAGAREAAGCGWQYVLRMRRWGTMGGKTTVVIYCAIKSDTVVLQ